MARFLIVNIQTTGIESQYNEMIAFNSILLDQDGKPLKVFTSKGKANFIDRLQKDAFNHLGITSIDEINNYPSRASFYESIIKFLNEATDDGKVKLHIISYTGQFEKNFIYSIFNEFTGNHGHDLYFKYFMSEYIALIGLVYMLALNKHIIFKSYKFDDVCEQLRIVLDKPSPNLHQLKLTQKLFNYLNQSL